jgi:phosphatidylglycerophosphate synthase
VYKEESYTSVYQAISRKFPSKEKKESSFFYNFILLYLKSLKPFYVEELLVFFIYRPLSFLLAFSVYKLPVSPNVITVLRSIGGVFAGVLFASGTYESIVAGGLILFISNIFDCADGQLARMRETSSWIGTTLDGIGDFTTTFSVYMGSAFCLAQTMPEGGMWFFLCGFAALSLIVHINGFGLFRYEFIHYTIEKYPEDLRTMEEQNQVLNTAKASNSSLFHKLFIVLQYIQVAPIEILTKIMFPSGYRGYKRWYRITGSADPEAKQIFRANYRQYNQRILQGFGTISMLSNLSMFVIAGIAGHLEWAIYSVIFGFNAIFISLVLIQRWSLKKQLALAGIEK